MRLWLTKGRLPHFRSATVGIIFLLFLVSWPLAAQERTGRIYGRITDASGGAVPGAQVVLTEVGTGVQTTLASNEVGYFSAPKLATGEYIVESELAGFKKYQRRGVALLAGQVVEANIALEVGEVSETVTVSEEVPLVNTTTGVNGTVVESRLLAALPLNARDAQGALVLVPGATMGETGVVGAAGLDGYKSGFSLDGTTVRDPQNSRLVDSPPPDALQEFTVETNFSAENGNASDMMVLMTTRNGTNQLHGSAYDYFRSENLNANSFQRNYYNEGKGDFKYHQLGFTVGGPVFLPKLYDGREKTFFFLSHQQLRAPSTPYLWGRGGLTDAELAGDFSKSTVIPTISSFAANQANSPFQGMAGQQITNLAPYLNSTSVALYKYFKMPIVANSGDRSFVNESQDQLLPEWVIRADHNIKQKNMLTFSMFYRYTNPQERKLDYAPAQYARSNKFKTQHYTLADVWTVTNALVNEMRLGYLRSWEAQSVILGDISWDVFNIPYAPMTPEWTMNYIGTEDSSAVLIGSWFNLRAPNSQYDGSDVYDFRDTVSLNVGNHFLKFGTMLNRENRTNKAANIPTFQATGDILQNQAAEFLIGWPRWASFGEPEYVPWRHDVANFFVQDDWKISPRLALNVGLRYEPFFWAYPRNGRALTFTPFAQAANYPNFPSGVLPYGDPGYIGKSGVPTDLNNWAPRLGFSYRLNESGSQVLRGAYGVSYNITNLGRASQGFRVGYPFYYAYSGSYDRGYPGSSWTDPPGYWGYGHPDFSQPIDPRLAVFDPQGTYGRPGSLMDKNTGRIQLWSVYFEHEMRPGWMYSIGYQGHAATGLGFNDFWNMPIQRDENDTWDAENMASRRPIQEYRYQTLAFWSARGDSEYHAALFKVKARTKMLDLLSWYSLARTRANTNGMLWDSFVGHPGPFDSRDWGRPSHSRTHNLMVVPSWQLPILGNRTAFLKNAFGGWKATFILNIQSGAPLDILAQNLSYQCGNCINRPNATGEPFVVANWRSDPNLVYLNAGAFSQPAERTYGSMGMNMLDWPATSNVDMSLIKQFNLHGEDVKFDLRLDAFNLFNSVNWVYPGSADITNPSSLSMTANFTTPPRTMQVSGRLHW